uniref:Uncharacterized protein n=1 Tax=Rhizophora mucronata TaxID=61149 RepID=A0A2P2QRT2_RHIMU
MMTYADDLCWCFFGKPLVTTAPYVICRVLIDIPQSST